MKINSLLLVYFWLIGMKVTGQTLIPYYDHGQYGYCDVKGKIVVAPKYDKVEFFSKDALAIVSKGNQSILINKKEIELLSFPTDKDIQILSLCNQQKSEKSWLRNQPRDTISHLKLIKLNEKEYQILNLVKQTVSPIYIFKTSDRILSYKPPEYYSFVYGYYIGKVSENRYDILNTDGEIIKQSQSMPTIWSPELISIKVNDKCCIYNPQNDSTFEYPYQSISNVIENKYVVVSNSEQKSEIYLRTLKSTRQGLITLNGQIIFDTLYQSIDFHNGTYILNRNGNEYLSDIKSILADSTEFKFIYPLNKELLLAKRHDNKIKILNLSGIPIFDGHTFDEFKFVEQQNYYVSKNGGISSVIDSTLNVEISLQADAIYRDYDRKDRYIVSLNGKCGIVNSKKDIIIPIQYDYSSHRGKNFIFLINDKKKGIADSSGRIILEPIYEDIQVEIVNGDTILRPQKNGFYASYNLEGKKLSEFNSRSSFLSGQTVNWHYYENSYHFTDYYGTSLNVDSKKYYTGYTKHDSVFIAVLYNEDSIKDVIVDGKLFHDWGKEYDRVVDVNISNGMFAVTKNGKIGVIDINHNIITPFSNQKIIEMNDEYYILEKKDKYFLYNFKGKQINKKGYDYIEDYAVNGRRSVGIIVPNKYYQYITDPCFERRLDTIMKPQIVYGYIDKFGDEIISIEYNSTFRFFEYYANLTKGYIDGEKESYLMDTLGNVVLKIKSDKLYPLNHSDKSNYYISAKGGKYGLIDRKGNTVIPFEYSAIDGFFEGEIVKVRDFNNVWHLINTENKHIFTGDYSINSRYEQSYRVGQNKILFFPNGNSEIIDRNGKSYLKIKSQNLHFTNYEELDLIEVRMNNYKYYINKEALAEYRNTRD